MPRQPSHLKRTRAGWATFLPLDTVRTRSALDLRPDNEIVGVASELVQYDERLKPVVELLLGRIVMARDLPAARRLLSRRTGASLYVTLEGETVQPSGAVSGGSRRNSSNLLARSANGTSFPVSWRPSRPSSRRRRPRPTPSRAPWSSSRQRCVSSNAR